MTFVIDIREASSAQRTGKGQWTYGFVSELLTREVDCVLLSSGHCPEEYATLAEVVEIPQKGLEWHVKAAQYMKARLAGDIYLSPTSYLVPFLLGRKRKHIPVVHDLIAFRGEPHDRKATLIEKITLKRAMQTSHRVLCNSESTRSDLLSRLPNIDRTKIVTVFAGPDSPNPERNKPDHKTILCIGTLCPRKNQLRLIEAYQKLPDALRAQYRLRLVGKRGWHDDAIIQAAEDTDGILWTDYASDEEYNELLRTCTVLALPSLYEGFGMQILDALQRGIPVLTSDRGSLREVASDSAMLCDPDNVESITRSVEALLRDDTKRQELASRGPKQAAQFTWKSSVDIFLSSLE